MTLAELIRAIESKRRGIVAEAKQKAINDYVLADLIGRSISRVYSSSNTMPSIDKIYPSLFDSEEQQELQQQRKDELSALRFKQFANAFNSKYKKEVAKDWTNN